MTELDALLAPRIVAERPPKILILDIETSPNLAHVWGLWDQTVSLNQLLESGRVICFAAQWYGQRKVEFRSDHHDGHAAMVQRAHALLSEADIVVHYNGKKFDIPHLMREFAEANMPPPAPHKDIDLLTVVKARFRFPSNKLDYVLGALLGEGKVKHEGHGLWLGCVVENDPKAWAKMRRYNIGDVAPLGRLYDRLRPWITNHPPIGLWSGEGSACPNCGGLEVDPAGWARTALTNYAQYQCRNCRAWLRQNHPKGRVSMRTAR